MIGFTLETNSFGERINLKSSPNRIIHTFTKVLITNKVILDLNHKCGSNYQFAISVRRPSDNGNSYSTIKPIIFNEVGKFDASAYFDVDCPKGTWQLQIFLKNKTTNLTEHFIFVDLVFSNLLEIKNDNQKCNELQFLNNNQLNINKENVQILSKSDNLKYYIEIYRKKTFINDEGIEETIYSLYYVSDIYKTLPNLELNWKTIENHKSIEKHILAGLNGESHIYVRIEASNSQSIDLPEFTYIKYKITRDKNLLLEYNGSSSSYVNLGNLNIKPTLPLGIVTKYDSSIIEQYNINCQWLLFGEVNSGKKDDDGKAIISENLIRILHEDNYVIDNKPFEEGQSYNRILIPNILEEDNITNTNYWNEKILPEKYYINKNNFIGNKSTKIHVKVTVSGKGKNESSEIDEQIFDYIFNRFSNLPQIQGLDGIHLGDIKPSDFNDPTKIEKGKTSDLDRLILKSYMVSDLDSNGLVVLEKFNVGKPSSTNIDNSKNENEIDIEKSLTVNEFNSRINFNTELINNEAMRNLKITRKQFNNLSDGKHSITVYASDGSGMIDKVDCYIKRTVTFNKVPNNKPVITTDNNLNLGKIAYAPKIVYHVTDEEKDKLLITELLDNNVIDEFEQSFDGKDKLTFTIDSKKSKYIEYFNQIKEDQSTHDIKIKVYDGYNTVELKLSFIKTYNSKPIISGSDVENLGNLIKPIEISYTVVDTNNDLVEIVEYFDNINENSIIGKWEGLGNSLPQRSINYLDKFNKASEGAHSIIITALEKGNESSKPVEKTYNFNKVLNSIKIENMIPADKDLGIIEDDIEISIGLYNLLDKKSVKNKMTYSVYVDTIKLISDERIVFSDYVVNDVSHYKILFELSLDSVIYKSLENGNHTIKIAIEDRDNASENITIYNFEKIQKNPELTLPKNQFFTYMYDMNNKIINYYSNNKCLLETYVTDDLGNSIFPESIFTKQFPPSSNGIIEFTFEKELWDELNSDEIKIYIINFNLTCLDDSGNKTGKIDKVSHRFIKSNKEDINQNVFTWRPNVDDDGDLTWSIDQSQSPIQNANIKGPIGETGPVGNTPKIDIGTVKNVDSGQQPKITINYPVDEDGNENREYPVLDFELPKGAGAGMYTSQDEVPVGIGGIPAGYKPPAEGIAIDDLFYMLLHPYTKPVVSLSMSPNGGIFEKGTSINITNIQISVSKKSNSIQYVRLYNGTTLLHSFTNIADGGVFSYQGNVDVTSTSQIKVDVGDGQTSVISEKTFTFVSPMYYGISANIPNNINGLQKDVCSKNNKTYTFTSSSLSYQIFAYPSEYGDLTSITDKTGFECISGFTKITLTVGNVNYNMYYTTAPSIVSGLVYNFKF